MLLDHDKGIDNLNVKKDKFFFVNVIIQWVIYFVKFFLLQFEELIFDKMNIFALNSVLSLLA